MLSHTAKEINYYVTNLTIDKPEESEYLPYYGRYISLVPDGEILALLSNQLEATAALLRGIPESQANFRYEADKWSIKQVVGHMIDTERIFACRALRFARDDKTPLPGYEQDDYIRSASFEDYPLSDLVAELESVRRSNVFLFKHLDQEAWLRRGVANDSEVSVRALAYIIAGHELHHRDILRTRYLPSNTAI
jgi:hypothetical protein